MDEEKDRMRENGTVWVTLNKNSSPIVFRPVDAGTYATQKIVYPRAIQTVRRCCSTLKNATYETLYPCAP